MGDWEFLPRCHYGFNAHEWAATLARFEAAAATMVEARRSNTTETVDGPRVLVEIRNDWSASAFMQRVRASCEKSVVEIEKTT